MKKVRLLAKASYHEEEVDSEGSWALSYGDLITLLLSFFVIFFSTDFHRENVDKLNRHLSFELNGAVAKPLAAAPLASQEVQLSDAPKVDIPDLNGYTIKAEQIAESVVITFQAVSFFGSGMVTPNSTGEALLREFAKKYLPYAGAYRLAIKGFTDKRPVTKHEFKKFEDNLELSALRSLSAMRILQHEGVPLNRMEIAGAGELQLIDRALPRQEGLTQAEIDAFSRTIVMVVRPIKESHL